jgi:phage terminase large subunit-like protein
VIVGVGLVELQHGELGIVLRADALVAEVAVDLVDAVKAADDQPLQIKLRRDAQKEDP